MTEKRELQIIAKLRDLASPAFGRIANAAKAVGPAIAAPFRAASLAIAGVATAGTAAFAFVSRYAADLDQVAKAADNLGVTTESLTALRGAAEIAGVSFGDLVNSVRTFEKTVSEANNGGVQQRQVLQQLGVQVEQFTGQNIDVIDVLAQVADGIQGVGGASRQTELLMKAFGEGGVKLAGLLKQGGDGVRALRTEAEALGLVFSRDELQRVEQFRESWGRLRQVFDGIVQQVTIRVAPAFTELFETLRKVLIENGGEIRDTFLSLLQVLTDGFAVLLQLFDYVRLSVEGWKLLTLSLSQFTAEIVGMDDAARVLNDRVRQQVSVISQLKDGAFAGSAALAKLRDGIKAIQEGKPITVRVQDDRRLATPPAAPADGNFSRFLDGARQARDAWADMGRAAFESGQQIVNGVYGSMTDALASVIDGTKSFAQAWKDAGKAVLGIIAQVIARLITVKIVSSLFGGASVAPQANGGVMRGGVTQTMPLRRFAMGGIVREPTLALVGEGSAPGEAFVPLPDGHHIPVDIRGGGAGGGTTNVYITAMDSQDVARALTKQRGLLRGFHQNDLSRRAAVRAGVQRAAR